MDPKVRREQILAAAEEVFGGRDPAEVTFEEVAEAAGVSRALVYNYFGDKSRLIAAVYLRCFQRLDEALAGLVHDGSSASEQVREAVRTYLQFAADNATTWKLMSTAESMADPIVQDLRRERYEELVGGWSDRREARLLAHGVIGLMEAATLDWLENPVLSLDEATSLIHAMVWDGLSGVMGDDLVVPALGIGTTRAAD